MEFAFRLHQRAILTSGLDAFEMRATFVCDKDSPSNSGQKAIDATVSATRHIESLSREEADEVWREHRRRSNEASVEMGRRFKEARAEKSEGEERELSIQCELFGHQLGWELRLFIDCELRMSQLCCAQYDVLDVQENWRSEMLQKRWSAAVTA